MANTNDKLNGFFIYQDKRGRNVYYDIFTKAGYLISKKDVPTYRKYNLRFTMALVGLCAVIVSAGFAYVFHGLAVAAVVYSVFYVLFRVRFLSKLPVIPDFKRPEKVSFIYTTAQDLSYGKIASIILAIAILITMFALNIYLNDMQGIEVYGHLALIAILVIFMLCYVAAAVIKKVKNY